MSEESHPRLAPANRARPAPGIVHLGLGAFFRAHGAIYIAEAIARSGGDWGVIGVSLQNPTVRDQLQPQGFVYSALELGPNGETVQIIDVVRDVLVARQEPGSVLNAMADPHIRIVSLTVTEKGYCLDPASGVLNFDHPDIRADLTNEVPVSAPGFLVRALQRRRAAGHLPFTVLCCDNLPNNGAVVRGVVLALARSIDPALSDWIAENGAFPATMVDRIVPATKPEDIRRLAEKTGFHDAAPVMHEPFRQWVIEDRFVQGAHPDLAAAGAQMVTDVTAYEHMKLRMLNGTHSALAYLGYLAGHETIAATVADAPFRAFVQQLWRAEIIPALESPPGVDLNAYAGALLDRYSNPAIAHRTWQIAMDGSQKLPQRILATLVANGRAGRTSPGLILAVAGWMRYVRGVDEAGASIDVRDPLAVDLRRASDSAADDAGRVAALLDFRQIFPNDLAQAIRPVVTEAYLRLNTVGARNAVIGVAG